MISNPDSTHHAKIEIIGATCTSCVFAIEKMGEKLNAVEDIWVDREHSCIHVDYTGNKDILNQICEFVYRIGYQATVVES